MTSDHYFSKSDLEAISARVQSGQPLHFDPKQVQEFVSSMETTDVDGKSVGRFILGFVALIIVILTAIVVAVRWFFR